MKQFVTWLKQALDQIAKQKDSLNAAAWGPQCFSSLDADVFEVAGDIAQQAGERAAKLGLSELAAEGAELEGMCDPDVVRSYLAKCIAACEKQLDDGDGPFTVAQAAKRLKVSAGTIYAAIESKRLPCERFGKGQGAMRITLEDLQEFQRQCRGTPTLQSTSARRKRLLGLP